MTASGKTISEMVTVLPPTPMVVCIAVSGWMMIGKKAHSSGEMMGTNLWVVGVKTDPADLVHIYTPTVHPVPEFGTVKCYWKVRALYAIPMVLYMMDKSKTTSVMDMVHIPLLTAQFKPASLITIFLLIQHNKNQQISGVNFHSAVILCARLCIAQQNLSIGVNVVSKGSPSRIFKVFLILLIVGADAHIRPIIRTERDDVGIVPYIFKLRCSHLYFEGISRIYIYFSL